MNEEAAIKKINPSAVDLREVSWERGRLEQCMFDEALGFQSSCFGASSLAHYSLLADTNYTKSRESCARELAKELKLNYPLELVEAMVEVFVNRHLEECKKLKIQIPDDVYKLLMMWEHEWMSSLGDVDEEMQYLN